MRTQAFQILPAVGSRKARAWPEASPCSAGSPPHAPPGAQILQHSKIRALPCAHQISQSFPSSSPPLRPLPGPLDLTFPPSHFTLCKFPLSFHFFFSFPKVQALSFDFLLLFPALLPKLACSLPGLDLPGRRASSHALGEALGQGLAEGISESRAESAPKRAHTTSVARAPGSHPAHPRSSPSTTTPHAPAAASSRPPAQTLGPRLRAPRQLAKVSARAGLVCDPDIPGLLISTPALLPCPLPRGVRGVSA